MYSGKIYTRCYINILEAVVYLNLIIISAITPEGLSTPGLVYTLVAFTPALYSLPVHCQVRTLAKDVVMSQSYRL